METEITESTPWLDEAGRPHGDEVLKEISQIWDSETWERFLQSTVDVELPENEVLVEDYESLLEETTEGIWDGPCTVPAPVRSRVEGAIKSLSPRQRAVIRGLFYRGLPETEVARMLRISQPAVNQTKIISLNNIRSLLAVDLIVRSYLIGGSKNFAPRKQSKTAEIREVYQLDLKGSYLK